MTDQTMRSLLEVHRTEISELEDEILRLNGVADGLEAALKQVEADGTRQRSTVQRLEATCDEWKVKYDKRGEVIDSLKLELTDARAQFTKAREAGDYSEATTQGDRP